MSSPPRVSSEDLLTFLAVAEAERVGAVADQLHMSQPTVTRAIGRLEKELGARLFDRPGHRVCLNVYGRAFAGYARRALAQLEAAQAELAALLDEHGGPVRIGFLSSLGTWFIPNLVQEFRLVAPNATFVLRQASSDALPQLLDDREVDLLFTSQRPVLDEPVAWELLLRERLELALPPGHHLAKRRRVRLREVASDPFVVLGADSGFRQITDQLCLRAGFRPVVAFESGELATVRALVASGLGVGIVPEARWSVAATPVLQLSIADAGAQRPIGMACATRREIPGASEAFRRWLLGAAARRPWVPGDSQPRARLS